MRYFKYTLYSILLVLIFCVGYNISKTVTTNNNSITNQNSIYNDISSNKDANTPSKDNISSEKKYNSYNDINVIVNDKLDLVSSSLDNTNTDINKDCTLTGNFNLLVSALDYNAIVSLNTDTKDVIITPINDTLSTNVKNQVDKYIQIDNNQVDFIFKDLDGFRDEFLNYSLTEKYNFIESLLNDSNTDLNMSDIINIAFNYIS